ncbi:MAG TPA: glycosyltransferase [Pyrinomonadaceae bacterium]
MTNPLLSVIIPTWNRAHVVCEAVASALKQRVGAIEVIVVDDASTDATIQLLDRTFGSQIQLLKLENRRGSGAARNAGAELARGEFVAFLDSDDIWLPGKLAAELRVFAEFPEANAVVSDSQTFFEGVVDASRRFAQNGLLAGTRGRVRLAQECAWLWTNSMNIPHTCGIIARREALAQIGRTLFAEDLACCEDWEFQMRLYQLGRIVILPEVFSWVRRFNDDSRPGRAIPGQAATREQEVLLLRSRLAVIDRSKSWLHGLRADLALELEGFRVETEARLKRLTVKVQTA